MDQIESDNANCLENTDNIETYLQNCKNRPTLYLTDDMVFKIVTICLMSISRLKNKESNEVQGVVAITLAILSQLLQFTITKLQETIIEMAVPDVEATEKENQASSESVTNNGNHIEGKDSVLSKGNNVLNLDENKAKSLDNGITNESGPKKIRDKSKSLLNKLRRRKRRTSSDSDASDMEQSTLASSSDEVNSDVSETEEDDALSEGNDALSDDNTDDEESSPENKDQTTENVAQIAKEEMNGHGSDITEKSENCNKDGTNHLVNGQQYATDQQTDSKVMSDKNSITDSGSAVTLTNTDSTSTYEESNDRSCNAGADTFYMTQLKKRSLKSDDILNMLVSKEILVSIKVCCDWLQSNPDIVRICAKSSRTLLKRITVLLNLIDVDIETLVQGNEDSTILSSVERLKEYVKTIPLPEDIDLRGLNLLESAHKTLDWQILRKHRINKREETLLRILKLIEFGHHLCSVEDSRVQYDQTERLFMVTDVSSNAPKVVGLDEKNFGPEHSKGKLMRHMGRLWLNAEVRALESQLRSRLMSPYLVPDHEALAKHMPALKRLVYAKKFIVVIPAVGK